MQLLPPRFPPPLFPISHTPPLLLTHKHMYTKRKIHLNTLTHTLCSHLSTHSLPLSLFFSPSFSLSPSLRGDTSTTPYRSASKVDLGHEIERCFLSRGALFGQMFLSLSQSLSLFLSLSQARTHTQTAICLSHSLSLLLPLTMATNFSSPTDKTIFC